MQHRRQQGFSLVEVIIATACALLLLSGLVTSLVASRRAIRVERALSELQEQVRFAQQWLFQQFSSAGFYDIPANDAVEAEDDSESQDVRHHAVVVPGDYAAFPELGSTMDSATGSDVLVINHMVSRDCRSFTHGYNGAAFPAVEQYYIEQHALKCRAYNARALRGLPVPGSPPDSGLVMLENVVSWQVRYGVLVSHVGQPPAIAFIAATQLGQARQQHAAIVALRLSLTYRSATPYPAQHMPTADTASAGPRLQVVDGYLQDNVELTIGLRNVSFNTAR